MSSKCSNEHMNDIENDNNTNDGKNVGSTCNKNSSLNTGNVQSQPVNVHESHHRESAHVSSNNSAPNLFPNTESVPSRKSTSRGLRMAHLKFARSQGTLTNLRY